MYKAINGFTKAKMIEVIEKEFKGKAMNDAGVCQYLTDDGRKCIAGCFIPDVEKYKDSTMSILSLMNNNDNLERSMPLEAESMREFQKIHDYRLKSSDNIEEQKIVLIDWVNENVY